MGFGVGSHSFRAGRPGRQRQGASLPLPLPPDSGARLPVCHGEESARGTPRPGMPATARLVQPLRGLWPPCASPGKTRPGLLRRPGGAWRGRRGCGHCACALCCPPPNAAPAGVEDRQGRLGFVPELSDFPLPAGWEGLRLQETACPGPL